MQFARMAMVTVWALVIMGTARGPALAQDAEGEALFRELVAEHSRALSVTEDRATGAGFDFLREEARAADIVLFGEAHGTAEIAWLAHHLYADTEGRGFDHLAIEVGPYATRVLEDLLREETPRAYETYRDSLNTGLAFPFAFFEEELELARAAVAAAPPPALWGLDQEFIAGGMILADVLAGYAETSAQQEAVALFREAAEANPMLVGSADPESFAGLEQVFQGTEEAAALVEEIIRSNRIYRPFTGRGGFAYLANLEREDQMKLNFLAAYAEARAAGNAAPRVMIKLGANHTSYGRSPTNVPGTGDFVREWGLGAGVDAFNLHADCTGGEARDVQSGDAVPCTSYRLGADSLLFSALGELDGPRVVDLRPLRPYVLRWDFLDPQTEDLIFAYDAYVVFPETTAATLLVAPLNPGD